MWVLKTLQSHPWPKGELNRSAASYLAPIGCRARGRCRALTLFLICSIVKANCQIQLAPVKGSAAREAPITSIDFYKELHQWVYHMQKELPLVDVICAVAERMYKAKGEERHVLVGELRNLLIINGDYQEALHVLDMAIEEYPDDVEFSISKASLYLYDFDDPEEALRCIDIALELATRTGPFRRHALGYKARILLELGRGQELSNVLEEIMSLRIKKGIPDIGRERDFVDRAPPGFIREDVLARYNQFRPRRPGDTNADEPPKIRISRRLGMSPRGHGWVLLENDQLP